MLKLIVGFVLSLVLQAAGQTCTNTCKYGSDGNCDDGGPGRAFGTDCGPRNQAPPPAPQPFCTYQLNSGLLCSRDFPVPCTYFTMNPTVCASDSTARSNINVTASAASTQVNIIVTTPTASATTDVEQMLSTSFIGMTVTSAPTIATGTIVNAIPPIMSAGLSVPNASAGSTLTLAIAVGVGSLVSEIAVTILVIRCGGTTSCRLTVIPCDDVPAAAPSRGGLDGPGGWGHGNGGRSSRNLFGSSRA